MSSDRYTALDSTVHREFKTGVFLLPLVLFYMDAEFALVVKPPEILCNLGRPPVTPKRYSRYYPWLAVTQVHLCPHSNDFNPKHSKDQELQAEARRARRVGAQGSKRESPARARRSQHQPWPGLYRLQRFLVQTSFKSGSKHYTSTNIIT